MVLCLAQFAAVIGAVGKMRQGKALSIGSVPPQSGWPLRAKCRFGYPLLFRGRCSLGGELAAFVHQVGLVILAALVTLGAGQPLSVRGVRQVFSRCGLKQGGHLTSHLSGPRDVPKSLAFAALILCQTFRAITRPLNSSVSANQKIKIQNPQRPILCKFRME